ncbi:MAG: hypothetical protein AAGJ17_11760 [Pseudomonadota bacterium]
MSKNDNVSLINEFNSDLKVCFYYNTLVLYYGIAVNENGFGEINKGLKKVQEQLDYIVQFFSSDDPFINDIKIEIDDFWTKRHKSPFESTDKYFYEFLNTALLMINRSEINADDNLLPFRLIEIQCETPKLSCELITIFISPYFLNLDFYINDLTTLYNNLVKRGRWILLLDINEKRWLNNYLHNVMKSNHSSLLLKLCKPTSSSEDNFNSLKEKVFHLVLQNEYQAYEILAKAKNALSSKRYRDSDNGKKTRNFNLKISTIKKLAMLAETTRLNQSELVDLIVERACEGDIDLEVRSAFLKKFSKSKPKPSSRSDS